MTIETFEKLCGDSIDRSELEESPLSDSRDSMQNITSDIGESYFKSMYKITFCKLCSIETSISLPYDHNNSKEHRDTAGYFIKKCMTYCEFCSKQKKLMNGENIQFQKITWISQEKNAKFAT